MTSTQITFKSEMEVELIDSMGHDYRIVDTARVSTQHNLWDTCHGADPISREKAMEFNRLPITADEIKVISARLAERSKLPEDERQALTPSERRVDAINLIGYLMKHRHGTPFEHGCATFFVNAPIFVWREWHRHRIGFSYNEESARYKVLEPVFYLPPRDRPMFRVDGWKPGRPKFLTIDEEWLRMKDPASGEGSTLDPSYRYDRIVSNLKADYTQSYTHYIENYNMGFDPGLARDGLNVGIYSSCWVTCNPRSIMAFLSLRIHDEAAMFVSYPLYEMEQAARKVEAIFANLWPITYKAFCDNGRVGP